MRITALVVLLGTFAGAASASDLGEPRTYEANAYSAQVYYRLDFEGQPPFFINDNTNWNYSSFPIGTRMPDGWRDSWRKSIVGVEWDHAPPTPAQGVFGGFWVRVQWRTVFILSSILPMIRIVQHYRRRAIDRQRGFTVDS